MVGKLMPTNVGRPRLLALLGSGLLEQRLSLRAHSIILRRPCGAVGGKGTAVAGAWFTLTRKWCVGADMTTFSRYAASAARITSPLQQSEGGDVAMGGHVVDDPAVAATQLALNRPYAGEVAAELQIDASLDCVAAESQSELLALDEVLNAVDVGRQQLLKAGPVILEADTKSK
eukprot:6198967-Pleurochrysis_carterae.AAC.4